MVRRSNVTLMIGRLSDAEDAGSRKSDLLAAVRAPPALLVQFFLHAQPVLVREVGSRKDRDALVGARLRDDDLVFSTARANLAADV